MDVKIGDRVRVKGSARQTGLGNAGKEFVVAGVTGFIAHGETDDGEMLVLGIKHLEPATPIERDDFTAPPRCPKCRTQTDTPRDKGLYWCSKCGMCFDNDPNEGGVHYNDPTASGERKEKARYGKSPGHFVRRARRPKRRQ